METSIMSSGFRVDNDHPIVALRHSFPKKLRFMYMCVHTSLYKRLVFLAKESSAGDKPRAKTD